LIKKSLLAEIRQHALSVPKGFESAGRLIVENGTRRALSYERLRNAAKEPGRTVFASSWRRVDGYDSVLIHSHPWGRATPSKSDLQYHGAKAHRHVFGIYGVEDDLLSVFAVAESAVGYISLPVTVGCAGAAMTSRGTSGSRGSRSSP
jgi:proteasome lid subunit RPN8/RPN11